MDNYLCIESGEKFILQATSMVDAQEGASVWNGSAVRKLTKAEDKEFKANGSVKFKEE